MNKEIKGENKVTQGNALVEALRDATPLSLQESRIVLTAISTLQPTDTVFDSQRISVQDLLKLFGITEKNHKLIEKACDSLFGKGIKIREGKSWTSYPWFQKIKYIHNEGVVEFQFPNDLQRYLLDLKKEFTSYSLEHILRLSSPYYQRIYELCFKWEHAGSCQFELQHLKNMIGAVKKTYDSYGPFKQKILIPAIDEINEKTDIKIDFEEIKKGRKVESIRFYIKLKSAKKSPKKDKEYSYKPPKKSIREEIIPEWFKREEQENEPVPEELDQEDLNRRREKLMKELASLDEARKESPQIKFQRRKPLR